jgi:hypothetical protein
MDGSRARGFGGEQSGLVHQRRKTQRSHTHTAAAEEITPCQERFFQPCWMRRHEKVKIALS